MLWKAHRTVSGPKEPLTPSLAVGTTIRHRTEKRVLRCDLKTEKQEFKGSLSAQPHEPVPPRSPRRVGSTAASHPVRLHGTGGLLGAMLRSEGTAGAPDQDSQRDRMREHPLSHGAHRAHRVDRRPVLTSPAVRAPTVPTMNPGVGDTTKQCALLSKSGWGRPLWPT